MIFCSQFGPKKRNTRVCIPVKTAIKRVVCTPAKCQANWTFKVTPYRHGKLCPKTYFVGCDFIFFCQRLKDLRDSKSLPLLIVSCISSNVQWDLFHGFCQLSVSDNLSKTNRHIQDFIEPTKAMAYT